MLFKLFKFLICLQLIAILLTTIGCGQSGPLYLPDQNQKKSAITNE